MTNDFDDRFSLFRDDLKKTILKQKIFEDSYSSSLEDFDLLEQELKCLIYKYFRFLAEVYTVCHWFRIKVISIKDINFESAAEQITFVILADALSLKTPSLVEN